MATQDISRAAFDPRKQYTSVRMQQGRVIMDDDWNENARIADEDKRRTRVETIGPAGSPDDGFAVANPHLTGDGRIDFDITAGSFYLGGNRLELHQSTTYLLQGDVLQPDEAATDVPDGARSDLAVLITWQKPVSAVEDDELVEKALGGPDTTTRLRTIQQVILYTGIEGETCSEAWQQVQNRFVADGLGSLNAEQELSVDAELSVSYGAGDPPEDLCTPVASGGYLGAENQAIRVQLTDERHLTWGLDNAAPLYRVQVAGDRTTVTLLTPPKDQAHWPLAEQTVEILPWSAVLPNNEKIAHYQGHLTRVSAAYNPDTGLLTLADPVPTVGFDDWQSRDDEGELEGDPEGDPKQTVSTILCAYGTAALTTRPIRPSLSRQARRCPWVLRACRSPLTAPSSGPAITGSSRPGRKPRTRSFPGSSSRALLPMAGASSPPPWP